MFSFPADNFFLSLPPILLRFLLKWDVYQIRLNPESQTEFGQIMGCRECRLCCSLEAALDHCRLSWATQSNPGLSWGRALGRKEKQVLGWKEKWLGGKQERLDDKKAQDSIRDLSDLFYLPGIKWGGSGYLWTWCAECSFITCFPKHSLLLLPDIRVHIRFKKCIDWEKTISESQDGQDNLLLKLQTSLPTHNSQRHFHTRQWQMGSSK